MLIVLSLASYVIIRLAWALLLRKLNRRGKWSSVRIRV